MRSIGACISVLKLLQVKKVVDVKDLPLKVVDDLPFTYQYQCTTGLVPGNIPVREEVLSIVSNNTHVSPTLSSPDSQCVIIDNVS